MPVLKCIGGTNDGKYYEVGSLKTGEIFQIPEIHAVRVVGYRTTKVTSIITSKYTLRYFNFVDKDVFMFLAPEKWSDKEAIEFQFRK